MRGLRIALCTPAYAPALDFGGPVAKVDALAHALRARGHDVEVWTADFDLGRGRVAAGTRPVDGVPVRYFRRVASYGWCPVVPPVASAAVRRGVDVAHCFGYRDGLTWIAAWGFRLARTPYVVEPLGMVARRDRSVLLKRTFDQLLGRQYFRGAARVVVNSGEEAADVAEAWPRLPVVVRANPIALPPATPPDPELRGRLGIPEDAFLVAWVGRVAAEKGLDVLLGAIERVESAHLVVVGPDGRRAPDLTDLPAGVATRVHRLGAQWGAARDRIVAAADALVLSSPNESFGNAAAEAMALGVPVVVTSGCGVGDLVERLRGGLVVAPDVGPLADGLRFLRDDPVRRRRLGRQATRIAEELAPDRIAARQEAVYEEALTGGGRR